MKTQREYELFELARQSAAASVDGEADAELMKMIAEEQNIKVTQKQAEKFAYQYNRAADKIARLYRE